MGWLAGFSYWIQLTQHDHISETFSWLLTLSPCHPATVQPWQGLRATNSCHPTVVHPSTHQPHTLIPDTLFAKEYTESFSWEAQWLLGKRGKTRQWLQFRMSVAMTKQECWGRVRGRGIRKGFPGNLMCPIRGHRLEGWGRGTGHITFWAMEGADNTIQILETSWQCWVRAWGLEAEDQGALVWWAPERLQHFEI